MAVPFIRDLAQVEPLSSALNDAGAIAVDCEAAGFHRYSDQLCLVQLSTESRTFILDPLALDLKPLLKRHLEDPAVPILMHGAAYDLRLLQRDLDIRVAGLVDTQVAASLLGEPGIGLQALLERHLGIAVSKKYQRADWAQRPLSDEMLEYAAGDTRHLHALVAELSALLEHAGRGSWAEEEYHRVMQSSRNPEPQEPVDPVTRVKGAKALDPVECTMLRAGLDWRDEIARSMDRAPFRVVSDQALLAVALEQPRSVGDFAALKGVSPRLAKAHGAELLSRMRHVTTLDPSQLAPYPASGPRPARPAPEVEAAFEALKAERNQVAGDLGLERGRLMSNQLLMEIALASPTTLEALLEVADIRKWQVDLFGDRLLQALDPDSLSPEAAAAP